MRSDLIPLYEQRFELKNATFSRIDHDDAMVAIVYKVTHNGKELILKICERSKDYSRESYFLKFFADKLPVPHVINLVQPEASIPGAILMEYLPGNLLKLADFADTLAFELGSTLASIHNNRTKGYGDITEALSPDPRTHFTLKFEEGLEECRDHLPKSMLKQCRNYYDTHVHLLDSVDGPCLIHRDFRPGNIIVNEGKIRGIIDWSSARSSFAEDDFCPMEHGEWPPKSKTPFLAGYSSIRPLPNYAPIMPFLRLNRAIATIGFMIKRGTWSTTHPKLYKFNRHFLEELFHINP